MDNKDLISFLQKNKFERMEKPILNARSTRDFSVDYLLVFIGVAGAILFLLYFYFIIISRAG